MYVLDEFHRHTTEQKKSDTKSTYHLITFIWQLEKEKLIYGDRDQNSGYTFAGEHEGPFWGTGNILSWLECGYKGVYLCKISPSYTL